MNPSGPATSDLGRQGPATSDLGRQGPADYDSNHLVLMNPTKNIYQNEVTKGQPDSSKWYQTNYGCLRTDPTMIARLHTFPDAMIPRGLPENPAPPSRVCLDTTCGAEVTAVTAGCTQYQTAWPQYRVDPNPMIQTEMNHPQFAFRAGGPATAYQIGVESQLRRLDQPLTNCQAVISDDAPLYHNTVAPPPVQGIDPRVQNATNPMAAMIMSVGAEQCRIDADKVAVSMSGRWANNPTRQDTKRFDLPFAPPGIGTGEARPRRPAAPGAAYYS
jgi:hypothetical protein